MTKKTVLEKANTEFTIAKASYPYLPLVELSMPVDSRTRGEIPQAADSRRMVFWGPYPLRTLHLLQRTFLTYFHLQWSSAHSDIVLYNKR